MKTENTTDKLNNKIIAEKEELEIGITESDKKVFRNIKQIMKEIEGNEPEIKLSDVLLRCEDLSYNPQFTLAMIDKLKGEGIIFEPRKQVYNFLE